MFETAVTYFINKYASQYIEKFDKSRIHISLFSGTVELEDLELKGSALKELNLPVSVVWGTAGRIHAKVKLSPAILKNPIVITIEDIYLLAVPPDGIPFDQEKYEALVWETKQKLIESLEEAAKNAAAADTEDTNVSTFSIINSLQVHIERLHIRFEELTPMGGGVQQHHEPFAMGVMLAGIHLRALKQDIDQSAANKQLDLEGLAMYWNCGEKKEDLWTNLSKSEKLEKFKASFKGEGKSLQFIVRPIDAGGTFAWNKKVEDDEGQLTIPRINVDFGLKAIDLNLINSQYQQLLGVAGGLAWMAKRAAYQHMRPQTPIKTTPLAWWKFAFKVAVADFRRINTPNTNKFLMERRRVRLRYIELRKLVETGKDKKEHQKELLDIEKVNSSITADVFFLWRRKARALVAAALVLKKKEAASKSWFGWSSKKEENSDLSQEEKMALEEREQFMKLSSPPEDVFMTTDAKEWKFILANVTLERVSASLFEDEGDNGLTKILNVGFQESSVLFYQRPNADGAVGGKLELGQLMLHMVRGDGSISNVIEPHPAKRESGVDKGAIENSTLALSFDQRPLVEPGELEPDIRLNLLFQPIQILVTAPGIGRVQSFFGTGVENVDVNDLGDMAADAVGSVGGAASKTLLLYLTEKRQMMDLRVHIEAPVIIIPANDSGKDNTLCLVADLGVLDLTSQCRDNLDNTEGQELSIEQVKDLAYDDFEIQLVGIQVLLAKQSEDWRGALRTPSSSLHLLDQVDVNLVLRKCLQDYSVDLSQFVVDGNMAKLNVLVSSLQLIRLNSLQASLTKEFGALAGGNADDDATAIASVAITDKPNAPEKKAIVPIVSQSAKAKQRRLKLALKRVFDVTFAIGELSVIVAHDDASVHTQVLLAQIGGVTLKALGRKYDFDIEFGIRTIELSSMLGSDTSENMRIPIILAHDAADEGQGFGRIKAIICQPESPLFGNEYSSTGADVDIALQSVHVVADQMAFCRFLFQMNMITDQLKTNALNVAKDVAKYNAESSANAATNNTNANTTNAIAIAGTTSTSSTTDNVDADVEKANSTATDAKIVLTFNALKILCKESSGDVFDLTIANLVANVEQKTCGDLFVKADLGSIELLDLTATDGEHGHIISSSEAFKFGFNQYAVEKDGVTAALKASGGKIHVLFLMYFVSRAMQFVDPIIAASEAVTETLSEVQDVYLKTVQSSFVEYNAKTMADRIETTVAAMKLVDANAKGELEVVPAMKLKLDINLDAPVVVLPLDRRSSTALALDLGLLTVKNKIVASDVSLVDDMSIVLRNVFGGLVEINNSKIVSVSQKMFSIVDAKANIRRCLWYSQGMWNESCPIALDIGFNTNELALVLIQSDLPRVMEVVQGNMATEIKKPVINDDFLAQLDALAEIDETSPTQQKIKKAGSAASMVSVDLDDIDDGLLFENVLATRFAGSGIKFKASIGNIVVALQKEHPEASQPPIDFASLSISKLAVDFVDDQRGIVAVDKGVLTSTVKVSLGSLSLVDKSLDSKKGQWVIRSATPDERYKTNAKKSSVALLDLDLKKYARAVQIVGYPQTGAEREMVPLEPEVVTKVFGPVFGPVADVFKGGSDKLRTDTATVMFQDASGLKDTMHYAHTHPNTYNEYISHINWDPDVNSSDITINFNSLEVLVALTFLTSVLKFVEMPTATTTNDDEQQDGKSVTAVKTASTGSNVAEVVRTRRRLGSVTGSLCPEPKQLVNVVMMSQKLVLLEDVKLFNTHRMECNLAASVTLMKATADDFNVVAVLDNLVLTSVVGNGNQHDIVPKLTLTAMVEGSINALTGEKSTLIEVKLSDMSLTASIQDIQFLTRLQDVAVSNFASDANSDVYWSDKVEKCAFVAPASEAGDLAVVMQKEFAKIDIDALNIELIDVAHGKREKIIAVTTSVAAVVEQWSSGITVAAKVQLAASLHNPNRATWEPLMYAQAGDIVSAGISRNFGMEEAKIVPVSLDLLVTPPRKQLVPSKDKTVTYVKRTKGSTNPAVMWDGNEDSFWVGGGSGGSNYVVFDFGNPVLLSALHYVCKNEKSHTPKDCSVFIGDEPDVGSPRWILAGKFEGKAPTDKAQTKLRHEEKLATVSGRYVKWVIHNRYSRGAAMISEVSFEIATEGKFAAIESPRGIELSVTSAAIQKLSAVSAELTSALAMKSTPHQLQSGGMVYKLVNYTGMRIVGCGQGVDVDKRGRALDNGEDALVKLFTPPPVLSDVDLVQVDELPAGVTLKQFNALAYLINDEDGGVDVHIEVEGWQPCRAPVDKVPSVQYVRLEPRWKQDAVRLAVSVELVNGMKVITLSSPCMLRNRTPHPIELSLTRSYNKALVDLKLSADETRPLPLGMMEVVEPDILIPLYRFANANTGRHFYTTDVYDVVDLQGSAWEQETILGFIFHRQDTFDAFEKQLQQQQGKQYCNHAHAYELWGAVPAADRSVSKLEAVDPSKKLGKDMENKGMRRLGWVYKYSDKLANERTDVSRIVQTEADENVDHVFTVADSVKHGNKNSDFLMVSSPGMFRVRPGPAFAWSQEVFVPRTSAGEPHVHFIQAPPLPLASASTSSSSSSSSSSSNTTLFTCALRSFGNTSAWDVCSIFSVKNTLPYPVVCGITTSQTEVPSASMRVEVAPGQRVILPYNGSVMEATAFLRACLTPNDLSAANWSDAGEMVNSGTFLTKANLKCSFTQENVNYKIKLKLARATRHTGDALVDVSLYCPYWVHDETGLGVNVLAKESEVSVWRPAGVDQSKPGLFSPFSEDLEDVTFTVEGFASSSSPLYAQSEAISVVLAPNAFADLPSHLKSAHKTVLESQGFDSKMPSIKSTSTDPALVFSSEAYWHSKRLLLWKDVYIKPSVVVINETLSKFKVARLREKKKTFVLQHEQTKQNLRSSAKQNIRNDTLEVCSSLKRDADSEWRIAKCEVDAVADGLFDNEAVVGNANVVTYGSKVVISHVETGNNLHSHGSKWKKGSKQFQTLTWEHVDGNDWWIVEPTNMGDGSSENWHGVAVRNGDTLTLRHGRLCAEQGTDIFLGTSNEHPAPISGDQYCESACYPTQRTSEVVKWVVQCETEFLQCSSDPLAALKTGDKSKDSKRTVNVDINDDHVTKWLEPGDRCPITACSKADHFFIITEVGVSTPFNPMSLCKQKIVRTPTADGNIAANRLTVDKTASTFIVSVKPQSPFAPFRFENHCEHWKIYLFQHHSAKSSLRCLEPGERVSWCMDDAMVDHVTVHLIVDDGFELHHIYLEDNQATTSDHKLIHDVESSSQIWTSPPRTYVGNRTLHVVPHTEETTGTRVVVLSQSLQRMRRALGLPPQIPEEKLQLHFRAVLPWIGISVIDSVPIRQAVPCELLYIRVQGLDLGVTSSVERLKVAALIQKFQIDYNADFTTDAPVLLYQKGGRPFARLMVSIQKGQIGDANIKSEDSYEYIGVELAKTFVNLDLQLIPDLQNFAGQLGAIEDDSVRNDVEDADADVADAVVAKPVDTVPQSQFFKEIVFRQITFVVTITISNSKYLEFLPDFAEKIASSIEDLDVTLNRVSLTNQDLTAAELGDEITSKYLGQAARISGILFKSMANVIGVGKHLSSIASLADADDDEGLKSADDFGSPLINLAQNTTQGGAQLVKGILGAATGLATNTTALVGSTVSALSFDKEYEQRRLNDMKNTKNFLDGAGTGVKRFGRGIFEGLTGVVTAPIREAKKGGALGAVKGVGMGLLGLTKIVGGTVDLVTSTVAGVEAQLSTKDTIERNRRILHIGPSGSIFLYSYVRAYGAAFLFERSPALFPFYVQHVEEIASKEKEKDDEDTEKDTEKSNKKLKKVWHVIEEAKIEVLQIQGSKIKSDWSASYDQMTAWKAVEGGLELTFNDENTKVLSFADPVKCKLFAEMLRCEHHKRQTTQRHDGKNLSAAFEPPANLTAKETERLQQSLQVAAQLVTESAAQVHDRFTVIERNRYFPIKGWTSHMLPTDPAPFSEEETGKDHHKLADILPPVGYTWSGDWNVRLGEGKHSKEGWQYAVDWPRDFKDKKGMMDYVRQRLVDRSITKTQQRGARSLEQGRGSDRDFLAAVVRHDVSVSTNVAQPDRRDNIDGDHHDNVGGVKDGVVAASVDTTTVHGTDKIPRDVDDTSTQQLEQHQHQLKEPQDELEKDLQQNLKALDAAQNNTPVYDDEVALIKASVHAKQHTQLTKAMSVTSSRSMLTSDDDFFSADEGSLGSPRSFSSPTLDTLNTSFGVREHDHDESTMSVADGIAKDATNMALSFLMVDTDEEGYDQEQHDDSDDDTFVEANDGTEQTTDNDKGTDGRQSPLTTQHQQQQQQQAASTIVVMNVIIIIIIIIGIIVIILHNHLHRRLLSSQLSSS
eukprot:m.152485 g.152485  ORF g.152485 m.152485 type:complete len:4348 (+) comp30808_c0_seq3:154-13197(+)